MRDRSPILRFQNIYPNNAKSIYQHIAMESNDVFFYALNDFCIEKLNEREGSYVGFDHVENWLSKTNLCNKMEPFDIWAEIRGILKGYMGTNWQRNYVFSYDDYGENSNKYLKRNGYIEEVDGDGKRLRCTLQNTKELNSAVDLIRNDPETNHSQEFAENIRQIYRNAMNFLYESIDHILILKSDYLRLGSKESVFSVEERNCIYDIAIKYQKWIHDEGFFDDNDLAGIMICAIEKGEIEKFDYIVVDEVQDLTELQIFCVSRLVNNLNDITFAGDIHQIVNPTYYRNDRLKTLYYLAGKEIKEAPLTKNFRIQRSIIEMSNIMGDIRKKYIAKEKDITEQHIAALKDGNIPFYLAPKGNNLKEMLTSLSSRVNTYIIISDEKDRIQLEEISETQLPNIFTIQEAKGLEFEYVFCYNLFPYQGPASRTSTLIPISPSSLATTAPPPPAPIIITSAS